MRLLSLDRHHGRSLQSWLRTGTVLAVLSGYGALAVMTVSLNQHNRLREHLQIRSEVMGLLELQARTPQEAQGLLNQVTHPGLELKLLPAQAPETPQIRRVGGQTLQDSISTLKLLDGERRSLLLRQNISSDLAQQTLSLQLLTAAAGLSALMTALLVRSLLHRGLVTPLQTLSNQLTAYSSLASPPPPLDVERQPLELRPIASSFNAMEERLSLSWERQRAFVDTVAHELRTPITLISGHAQSLQRQQNLVSMGPTLALIHQEALRMSSLVSDMLDLARKDAGRLELERVPIDVEDLMLEVFERLAPAAAGRLRLQEPSPDQPLPLAYGDRERLAQCLLALIDNALRYAPNPSVVNLWAEAITGAWKDDAEPDPREEDGRAVVLHVIDRGPGVPPEERQRIFERFVRGSAALDTRGSGIGLAVVKLLMEAMGGRVLVLEAPEGGADFQLRLPLRRQRLNAEGPP